MSEKRFKFYQHSQIHRLSLLDSSEQNSSDVDQLNNTADKRSKTEEAFFDNWKNVLKNQNKFKMPSIQAC